jgi:integrase
VHPKLLNLADPRPDQRVRLELKAQRVELGVRQRQALGLRFKGEVRDPLGAAEAGGVCVAHLLKACPRSLEGLRDKALLSVAYDTGLWRAELVRIARDHVERLASGAGRLFVPASKTDRDGAGSYAFLSVRSMRALKAWPGASGIAGGTMFRRLHRSRTKEGTDVWTPGRNPLSAQPVSLIYKAMARRAHDAGFLDELDGDEFERWLAGLLAHSTRVGPTQDLFAAGQDFGMQALRWKSPAQPAHYAQALAVEANAAAEVVGRL